MYNKLKKALSMALAMVLSVGMIPTSVTAAEAEQASQNSGYVLMNIPYDEFFEAEGVSSVDAVTTATVKTYNTGKAAGSYHEGYEAADPISDAKILGVTYPVYVEDMSLLKDFTKVTDADKATITVAAGKKDLTTKEVEGADLLIASGTYAYYELAEEPTHFKVLEVKEDKTFSFTAVNAKASTATVEGAELKYATNYTNIEFIVPATEVTEASKINAVTLVAGGEEYALRHVENIWDGTDLGWNWTDLDDKGLAGKTITNVTYYLQDAEGKYGIYSYDVNLTMKLNPGEVTAEFKDEKTVELTGLPADIKNAKATVKTKVGKGQTATTIAESVAVTDGKVTTTDAAGTGTYVITVVSDNYGDVKVNADSVVVTPDNSQNQTPDNNQTPNNNPTPSDNQNQTPNTTVPSVSEGQTETVESHTYKVTKAGTDAEVAFVKTASKATKVTIPATVTISGVECKVTSIAANAFKNNKKLKTVVIGSNVKTIGKNAFVNCKALKKVTIKSTVLNSIGKKAFRGIPKNVKIAVPKNMKKAKKNALIKKIKKAGTPKSATVK